MSLSARPDVVPVQRRFPTSQARLRGMALREYLLGNLSLDTASGLAGLSEDDFAGWVADMESAPTTGAPETADPAPASADIPRLSIVVPVYNEEESLTALYERLAPVLASIGSYEIIFVDDGSADRSREIAGGLAGRDPAVRLLPFSRNFGHQAALSAGLDHARGDAVVFIDADLQDPPELLPTLVEQWEAGHDVVYAVRRSRDEGVFKRASAGLFYRMLRAVADVDIPVDTGDFCLIDRRVADVLRNLPEKNRFLRGLRSWAGFRQIGVPYDRPARHAGEKKYTLGKMVKLGLDGIMAFTSLPLRLACWLGFLTTGGGLAFLAFTLVARLTNRSFVDGWHSLVTIILLIGGMQLIVLGVLGAYLARIYEEAKHRPIYVIDPPISRRDGRRP
ncbi:MAG: glycosyltransferase family 2 protein [Acidimicrobiia bacterium]